MKTFISDPAVLCRWEFKDTEALIKLGVKSVILLTDGVEVPNPVLPSSMMRPWSRVIQEDVWHSLRQQGGLTKGASEHVIAVGWGLADYTEAKAREDERISKHDAVLCFSDRRIREWIAKDDPHFFDDVGGVHVPEYKQTKPAWPRTFGRIRSTNMGTVAAKDVPWLWPGRVPLGMLTIFAGSPGVGKSFVSLYLAGRITTGAIWPDVGKSAPEGTVILLSAEDSTEYTIKPRLDALGADATKIEKIDMVATVDGNDEKHFSLADDLKDLEIMVLRTAAKLVIIDPVNSYLGGKQDGFKDVEVRKVLDPLKELAERLNVAIVLLMHTKKGIEEEILYQIGGSIAFSAVARNVFFCTRDPETPGRFYFTHPKTVKVESRPLSYTISGEAGVVWGSDEIKLSAREILAKQHQKKPGPQQTARKEAKQWLVEYLKDGPQTDGWAVAASLGLREKTVQRALVDLCVQVEPVRNPHGQITHYAWSMAPVPEEYRPF